jgi:hypothetical protein
MIAGRIVLDGSLRTIRRDDGLGIRMSGDVAYAKGVPSQAGSACIRLSRSPLRMALAHGLMKIAWIMHGGALGMEAGRLP